MRKVGDVEAKLKQVSRKCVVVGHASLARRSGFGVADKACEIAGARVTSEPLSRGAGWDYPISTKQDWKRSPGSTSAHICNESKYSSWDARGNQHIRDSITLSSSPSNSTISIDSRIKLDAEVEAKYMAL
jgi:hypothetical protein